MAKPGNDTISALGRPLASGRTAEIFAWPGEQALKLFYDGCKPEDVESEARTARAIHAGGLPVPAVGEIVRVGNRIGLLYQRVDGDSMWQMLSRRPWKLLRYARRMAELHAEMHARVAPTALPSQRQQLLDKIRRADPLPAPLRFQALGALETLADGERLCHGDFHAGNILMSPHGEKIIDWRDASGGNPSADLARSSILTLGALASGHVRTPLRKAVFRSFHGAYLRHYLALSPGREDEYRRWLPSVAAARLSERIPEVEQWLLAQAQERV